ncbi:putative bifunctional diguanylate cyclase/phosphodiesterase [Marichromatium bheemlicum]|uniref:EAL domain-containing protein n=1 Tax=Marichromatium bheemlicum TaxID=365339 RepID=A0ABX1I6T4_9GAMM|nr:EAL domain-containing protein [Marichromatium bheemlicum]NKN31947.1 EAL domain-containing protein [Marichromatium bheemlicum]
MGTQAHDTQGADVHGRVLVVDDDAPTRGLICGALRRQGFVVEPAVSGAQALACFARSPPDLVLLDVRMPGMDGVEVCRRIRALEVEGVTPVIMVTGADEVETLEAALEAGATDFMVKPINWSLLIQRVRYALHAGALSLQVQRNHQHERVARRIARLAFWQWSLADDALSWSDDAPALLGVDPEALGRLSSVLALVHPADRARVERMVQMAGGGRGQLEFEFRLCTEAGERLLRVVGERAEYDTDRVLGVLQDLTEMRRTEALVDYLSLHDELTGLANRRLFLRQADAMLHAAAETGVLVGWIDLTEFHRLNDALGESTGDQLLGRLARRLELAAPPPEAVARVGGDEFAVLLCGADLQTLQARFAQLLRALGQPYPVEGRELVLTLSGGVACYPRHANDAKQLLALAEQAQRLARVRGTLSEEALAEPQLRQGLSAALELERALHGALEREEFHLHYQPQLELDSGRVVAVEALLRWRHPRWGELSPARFVPLLESLGLIQPVGAWVLEQACRQCVAWRDLGLGVAVNLSARQFLDPGLFGLIERVLGETGVDPGRVELEITERLAMQEPEAAVELLGRCRALGLKVAIDDFGIGYSSLEYLQHFPLDVLKIDRAFVATVTRGRRARAIVRAITVMGQSLGLTVIAEGIETQRQYDFVEALGVDQGQGYLIGRPLAAAALEALLDAFEPPGVAR